ncbi:spermatogenesis-associated protein 4 [Kappamyces sp. JEL0680]|nr:spermatogenesis-associated protein 4 [Kappamyces sp. JEL0680]
MSPKNYRRDFSNGFLIGEILSKYYPLDIQMHSFDLGTGTNAKKNNWSILDRIFTKHKIPITRELSYQVSSSVPKATTIVLSLIHSHVHSKSYANSQEAALSALTPTISKSQIQPSTSKLSLQGQDERPAGRPEDTDTIAQLLNPISINPVPLNSPKASVVNVGDEREDTTVNAAGKLACIKILFSIFISPPPNISFVRSMYQPHIARDMLLMAMEKNPMIFKGGNLSSLLAEKSPELLGHIAQHNMSDFAAVFDTFLPLTVQLPSSSVLFQACIKTLCHFGKLCQQRLLGSECFRKLSTAREFVNFIRLVSLKSMDKIPFVASVVHAFLGSGATDAECVKTFLELKNAIMESHAVGSQLPMPSSPTGAEYLFFLAAFNDLECHAIHASNKQLTVFHLSECLTVINSYKTSQQRRLLLVSKDEEKNTSCSIISTADLPSLEVSAILHILASILKCKVSLQLRVLSDVVCSALRIFFKIVVHSNCPSSIRKAYVLVLLELFETREASQLGIQNDIFGSLVIMMRKFKGETLRDVLYIIAPVLGTLNILCTPFVTALLGLPSMDRARILEKSYQPLVSWDLPFLFDPETPCMRDSWYAFGMIMGVVKLTESQRSPLTIATISILHAAIDSDPSLSAECLDTIFNKLCEHLMVSFGVEEASQGAWDLLSLFMIRCTPQTITKVFDWADRQKFSHFVSVLIYVHTLENTKCRRRLMGRLRKLSVLDLELLEATDRYMIFSCLSTPVLRQYQREAERVLTLFRQEFPVVATQKAHLLVDKPLTKSLLGPASLVV